MSPRRESPTMVLPALVIALAMAASAPAGVVPRRVVVPPPGAGAAGPPAGEHAWETPSNTSITQAKRGWVVWHALQLGAVLLLIGGGGAWVWLVRYDRRRTRRLAHDAGVGMPGAREGVTS